MKGVLCFFLHYILRDDLRFEEKWVVLLLVSYPLIPYV